MVSVNYNNPDLNQPWLNNVKKKQHYVLSPNLCNLYKQMKESITEKVRAYWAHSDRNVEALIPIMLLESVNIVPDLQEQPRGSVETLERLGVWCVHTCSVHLVRTKKT